MDQPTKGFLICFGLIVLMGMAVLWPHVTKNIRDRLAKRRERKHASTN